MGIKSIKPGGKALIGILVIAAIFAAKVFWWDNRAQDVGESKTFGTVAIPDAPEASLVGENAIKLELPTDAVSGAGDTKITWYQMAWQSQNGIAYSNGGPQTTKGSLFEKAGLDVSIVRQDDCAQQVAELIKFTEAYKEDPNTPGVFITFMGSGIPAYITSAFNALEELGPEYQPIAFLSTGKSYGEDQIIGPKKYKDNKQLLKGATVVGYRMDGDLDLAFKLAGDNGIRVNVNDKVYDPEALNFMYCKDFLDAVVKYNAGTEETRKIVKKGVTTGRDTSISADMVATWTPGDVNAYQGKGGVTIVSTRDYASMMPNITITCKKWLNDHRTAVEELTKACAMAGDQIRSFEDVKKYACGLVAKIYNEQNADYWYKYYNGFSPNEDTHLGGSMVFNLADMAKMFGVPHDGQSGTDIYREVYNTFGNLQSKYYPEDLPKILEYSKAFDKSVIMSVVSNNPDLLKGKVNAVDYATTKMTNKISNKSYNIVFQTGSAEISDESEDVLDEIFSGLTTADGTKVEISGHTDNVGNPASNQTLSEQRATSVLNYLKRKGVETTRLTSNGYGQDRPVADNSTAAGKAKNRRVEISILGR